MKRIWLALLLGLTSSLIAEDASQSVVRDIGGRRELFVDDFLIERHLGTELRPQYPEAKDVALECDAPWEGNTSAYYTLIQDADRIRMYYRGSHFNEQTKQSVHPEFTCYAESRDGVQWQKPELGLIEFNGSKRNNIVWAGEGTHNFAPFKDDRPDCPAAAKYKALAGDRKGLMAYQSSDGLHWSLLHDAPVITRGAFDSQNLAFWDAEKAVYRAYWRYFTTGGAKVKGVRAIRTAVSKDFIHWEQETDLAYGAVPDEHLYTNAIRPYFRAPHLYLGFPTRFQPKHQQVEPILMTSRDGVTFSRWAEPLIPITAPKDRDGNRSNYMTNGLIQLPGQDREVSLYATEAYYAGPGSRVRRFTLRTDGFVALSAGEVGGSALSRRIRFSGQSLVVNYRARTNGHVRIELQDAAGQVLPGFGLADCEPLKGDAIGEKVTWKNGSTLKFLAGQVVRMKWELVNSDLFALQFVRE